MEVAKKPRRFFNPRMDTAFKIIFGRQDVSEEFLIDFLNEIFRDDPDFNDIVSVQYANNERHRDHDKDKRIIYDINCITSTGHRFVVEMQHQEQENFINRAVFYAARAINEQGARLRTHTKDAGKEWNLIPVVMISVCDFPVKGLPPKALCRAALTDDVTGEIITKVLRAVFIQLPWFTKTEAECETGIDKWIYILKNMENLDSMPFETYKDRIFERLADVSDVAMLAAEDRVAYEADLKWAMDYNGVMNTQYNRGRAEGKAEGQWTMAENLYSLGVSLEIISRSSGLPLEELRRKLEH